MTTVSLEKSSIYIVGAGAQTPVGRSVHAAAAAVRCHLSAYAEHPFMFDQRDDPMIVARAMWLDETLPLEDRIVALAVGAAREATRSLEECDPALRRQVRIHLALSSETVPDAAQRQRIIKRFADEAAFTETAVEPIVDGHAGGLLALEHAVGELHRGEALFCLVGGADSWLDPQQLDVLDRARRLRSTEHAWGFTPGEGAGFCLVTTSATAQTLGLPSLAALLSVATARETKLMGTKSICTGEGLTSAFLSVLNSRPNVAHSYCDLNGETYRADEYGFTLCRTSERFMDARRFTAAAECWGDVGAASGPLAITLPIAAWSRGYATGEVILVWSSSASSSLRAAALLKGCSSPPPA